jgi:hypothetical protein
MIHNTSAWPVIARGALASACAWTAMVGVRAAEPLSNPGAPPFESGGASESELNDLASRAGDYNFKLVLAAQGSGAYLADVDVSIRSLPSHQEVLDTRTEGPWLLAQLPAGRYEVQARYADVLPGSAAVRRQAISVPSHGQRAMVLYFNTGDAVSDEAPRPSGTGTRRP